MREKSGSAFSRLFTRLRKEAGFATAYQFFHGNGGRKVFQCTFSNYLRIEKGETLPPPRRLPALASLLRLPLKPEELRALAEAYLETWAGSSEVAEWLGQALRCDSGREPPPDPSRQALHRVVRQSARPVGMKEYRAIMVDAASYWCYRALAGSSAPHGPAELSRVLGIAEPKVKRGLERLRQAGFAQRRKDGTSFCPAGGQHLLFPDPSTLPAALVERPMKLNRDMARRKGALLMVRHCGIRVDLDRFEGFLPFFREAIRSAQAYSVSEKSRRSALVFIEGRVYKALDF
jgi:hypothetical protein